MNRGEQSFPIAALVCAASVTAVVMTMATGVAAQDATAPAAQAQTHITNSTSVPASPCNPAGLGSPFIPVDSWVYPAVWRLYALGYVDSVFLGIRPWTRASVAHMLEETGAQLENARDDAATQQARSIYDALNRELNPAMEGPCGPHRGVARLESTYTIMRGISGTPLEDSYHLGSTFINDYGRPYENGFNNYSGVSGYVTAGRFTVYVRGEFRRAPSAAGYSQALAQELATDDRTNQINPATGLLYPQRTIPEGPIAGITNTRFLEAYVSAQVLNHVISFGKEDEWLGPAQGGSFAYSNNAENIYGFHINRIEPLHVPLLSLLTGPFRYEFLVGALRGHALIPNPNYHGQTSQPNVITPGDPWVHLEKINFKPTPNLEFGFERTVIWGGEGHEPITLHTFLKSFFSFQNVGAAEKYGRGDPGARFGSFDVTYRLPFLHHWLTFYADGEVHDDVSPIDAPRRAAWRPGLYLSHVPGAPKLDIRFEGAMTDPSVSTSQGGGFMYYEVIQRQGYTNEGQIFGDWMGREAKGGQAWITYHLNGDEWLQLSLRNQKAAKDFIPGGTTLNDVDFEVVKRLRDNLQLNGDFLFEHWKAPIYLPGLQTVTGTTIQLTWFPHRQAKTF